MTTATVIEPEKPKGIALTPETATVMAQEKQKGIAPTLETKTVTTLARERDAEMTIATVMGREKPKAMPSTPETKMVAMMREAAMTMAIELVMRAAREMVLEEMAPPVMKKVLRDRPPSFLSQCSKSDGLKIVHQLMDQLILEKGSEGRRNDWQLWFRWCGVEQWRMVIVVLDTAYGEGVGR
ncbi:hypothetical protein F0562_008193 [Nyssa sinensis]|uniref:Uncharacterized protein n=1 Tax=Nyssa sinensis TaxID=561372 RepID=A0A5J5A8Q3_9ASTE|nr:hypothetical protein F0562_008193 [Nyssa sinensis]